jgi:hypothetical protein
MDINDWIAQATDAELVEGAKRIQAALEHRGADAEAKRRREDANAMLKKAFPDNPEKWLFR